MSVLQYAGGRAPLTQRSSCKHPRSGTSGSDASVQCQAATEAQNFQPRQCVLTHRVAGRTASAWLTAAGCKPLAVVLQDTLHSALICLGASIVRQQSSVTRVDRRFNERATAKPSKSATGRTSRVKAVQWAGYDPEIKLCKESWHKSTWSRLLPLTPR